MDGVSISAISMANDLLKLDALSHNVANIATPAYKRQLTSTETFFASVQQLQNADMPQANANQNLTPSVELSTDFGSGALTFSGNPLDLAIEGDGFFELVTDKGKFYTKRGDFSLDETGRIQLKGTDKYLNGVGGDLRIESTNPTIDLEGRIFEDDRQVGQLKVVHFSNVSGLEMLGDGVFVANAGTVPKEVELASVRQGHLESSNVQPADEMLELIKLMGHMGSTQQIIRGYDGMMETVLDDLGNF